MVDGLMGKEVVRCIKARIKNESESLNLPVQKILKDCKNLSRRMILWQLQE